jgi:UDP-N-acetylglucosamine 2-epimerase (non-hydrolysing)/GDP/UDP-N,N'-diacetylbacillosamine 2-epimerase (hydrolysing)
VRTLAVVTVARSDYGIYLPILRAIQARDDLRLHLIVSGAHLSPEFGMTVQAIEADGFDVSDRVEMLVSSDTPEGTAASMGLGLIGFSRVFQRARPDMLVVLGDRFEMFAAALAALPFVIPVAHIHGGEVTHGAMDDALRHAMTKLSHLHFVSTAEYARRVAQLGEDPWRVLVSGAPGLDHLRTLPLLSPAEIESRFGITTSPPPLLVTFHPVTLEPGQAEAQARELLNALERAGLPMIFTQPNADAGGRLIGSLIDGFVASHPLARRVDNLGTAGYFSLMRVAAAMVGNSSSGIIEAASFELPVVNVGSRQGGRVRAANVIDVGNAGDAILAAIRKAVDPAFRAGLSGLVNPYGDGQASTAIVERLRTVALDERLRVKRFHDM